MAVTSVLGNESVTAITNVLSKKSKVPTKNLLPL